MDKSIAANQAMDAIEDVICDLKSRQRWGMIRLGLQDADYALDDLAEIADIRKYENAKAFNDIVKATRSPGLEVLNAEATDLIRAAMVAVLEQLMKEVKTHE